MSFADLPFFSLFNTFLISTSSGGVILIESIDIEFSIACGFRYDAVFSRLSH